MNLPYIWLLALGTGFLFLILMAEFIHKQFRLPPEYTRKFAHIIATLSSLVFLIVFDSYWQVLILGLFFFLLLFVGKHFRVFSSIDDVGRKTAGSYLLPVSICLLFFLSKVGNNQLYFILPIMILGISDPLAGLFGTLYKHKTKKIKLLHYEFNKTRLGSTVFFITTFIITLITLYVFQHQHANLVLLVIIISICATFIELISIRGIDNLTVPVVVFLILYMNDILINPNPLAI